MELPPYRYAQYHGPPPSPETAEANPLVLALQKQVDGILGELQAERTERAKEKEEQRQKERDAALQGQINAVAGKVDSALIEISGVVKGLTEQIQRGYTEGETSRTQQLAEKVDTLTETIASQREAHLQSTVDGLRGELGEVRQKLNAEPTGKTTEDLISQAVPLALQKLDSLGDTVKGELQGIRQQAADGKLPSLTPPTLPGAGRPGEPADPVKAAQQIAGARALEDELLTLTAGRPRS
jgi:uncharacterized protein YoxC